MEVERSKFSFSPATIQALLIEHKNDAQEALDTIREEKVEKEKEMK